LILSAISSNATGTGSTTVSTWRETEERYAQIVETFTESRDLLEGRVIRRWGDVRQGEAEAQVVRRAEVTPGERVSLHADHERHDARGPDTVRNRSGRPRTQLLPTPAGSISRI
jgi:hypothetical protein